MLTRDDTSPLELNVIDNYQAGSLLRKPFWRGGFIVSLALALGFPHGNQNVRVDSLFWTKGSALDEEALDTALETLAGLQQEAS